VTLGRIGPSPAAAVAAMPQGVFAGITRRDGKRWNDLLLHRGAAIMQSVVKSASSAMR
jgi:hypothetical protein